MSSDNKFIMFIIIINHFIISKLKKNFIFKFIIIFIINTNFFNNSN